MVFCNIARAVSLSAVIGLAVVVRVPVVFWQTRQNLLKQVSKLTPLRCQHFLLGFTTEPRRRKPDWDRPQLGIGYSLTFAAITNK